MPAKRPSYPYVEPTAAGQTRADIERLAERVAQEWDYHGAQTLDEVCTAAGVDIEYSHRPNEIMLEMPLDARPIVWLPRPSRPRDDRVIVATALGHWALHAEVTRDAHPGCGVQALYQPQAQAARDEADIFALAFLMPVDLFIDLWDLGRSQATSDHFDVPTKVAYLRAKNLNLGDTI
ncbi:ImmA/IrrE family metallo-endopeptidase [Yoonia sp. BS5-3]|uniref:ImmA/IrrE family metallo-endopeptidase n=1 Tax=Yoonia phaeophyticola TaxID=3137369 RepID=A0ABZ2V0W7_9RHOB